MSHPMTITRERGGHTPGLQLPESLTGHWDTAEGRDMALRYADHPRPAVNLGSDMALANAAYMHLHEPLGTATKERMRWLSVQLAIAHAALRELLPEGWGDDDTMDHMPGVRLARAALAKSSPSNREDHGQESGS